MKRKQSPKIDSPAHLFVATSMASAADSPDVFRNLMRTASYNGDVDARYDENVALEILQSTLDVMEETGQDELDLNTAYGLGLAVFANGNFPPFGDTALHLASRLGSGVAAALLMEFGADVSATNADGLTAQELACARGEDSDLFHLLVAVAGTAPTDGAHRSFVQYWLTQRNVTQSEQSEPETVAA